MVQQLDSATPVARDRVLVALSELLDAPEWDRRADRRIAYFGPVTIGLAGVDSVGLSAFARDVSASGLGLVHLMPLKQGEVVVTLPLPSGRLVTFRSEIVWCRDYGNGWYASGARFLDVCYHTAELNLAE